MKVPPPGALWNASISCTLTPESSPPAIASTGVVIAATVGKESGRVASPACTATTRPQSTSSACATPPHLRPFLPRRRPDQCLSRRVKESFEAARPHLCDVFCPLHPVGFRIRLRLRAGECQPAHPFGHRASQLQQHVSPNRAADENSFLDGQPIDSATTSSPSCCMLNAAASATRSNPPTGSPEPSSDAPCPRRSGTVADRLKPTISGRQ